MSFIDLWVNFTFSNGMAEWMNEKHEQSKIETEK